MRVTDTLQTFLLRLSAPLAKLHHSDDAAVIHLSDPPLTLHTHMPSPSVLSYVLTFCPVLSCVTPLQVLRLARNRLQSLPEALGAFSGLQVLDCSGNRLTSVPRVVGRCLALQQLLMSSNRLRGLTSGIGNLVRLQLLDLSHNQYRHLPTMTGDLTQLRVGRDRGLVQCEACALGIRGMHVRVLDSVVMHARE